MADKLKDLLNETAVRTIASELRRAYPAFPETEFVETCLAGLDGLELTPRAWHIAAAMHRCLPQPFAAAAAVVTASFGPELDRTDNFGLAVLRYMPHAFFVQKYGLDDFEAAMQYQYELTKRFTAESSIRAFLVKYPEATYARLVTWTSDPSVHVRRLVSEGTRPRLPWAPRLRAYQDDPAPVLRLLELLKDDPERYVQRSVANNLNDIGKDHPEVLVETCKRWLVDATPGRVWIVQHALRSLVKQGHPGALEALGAGGAPEVRIEAVSIQPPALPAGGRVRLSFRLVSTSEAEQTLVVDYAVHFVKANGQPKPKVFKLKRLTLAPHAAVELASSVSLDHLTTRRHYPGLHQIDLLINGISTPLGAFELLE